MANTPPQAVGAVIGFTPYVQALRLWTSGLTTVWCYKCGAFTRVMDDAPDRTFRCCRLPRCDLLKQVEHLSAFQSEDGDEADSTEA